MGALRTVQADPAAAIANASARAGAGPRFADDAALELFLDMPDSDAPDGPGPPKDPERGARSRPSRRSSTTGSSSTLLDANPIQAGILAPLRREFGL